MSISARRMACQESHILKPVWNHSQAMFTSLVYKLYFMPDGCTKMLGS